jgi:hypothetical protein
MVPKTPRNAQPIQAVPFPCRENAAESENREEIIETGISATQSTKASKRAGPLNPLNAGCPDIQRRTEVIVNKEQCRTGARILARASLDMLKSYFNETL